ncbi:MAG: selenoneine synthase SenA [Burkholderiales bacterium]
MPAAELVEARARLKLVADDLRGEREWGPRLSIVNPPRWELGHVGWFQEYWCLRRAQGSSILPDADNWYNSATVPHARRWDLPLPDFDATLAYRDEVLVRVLDLLAKGGVAPYFAMLAARHEDMHAEAFHYTRQTLAYPAPDLDARAAPAGDPLQGDVSIPGGVFPLGSEDDGRWVFDNEKWTHPVVVRPFRIARTPVTNAEYLRFVEAGGTPPGHWRQTPRGWEQRRFDRWLPLAEDEPVIHVSCHQAEAYCRHAGRRLPTEAEWEFAATWDPVAGRKRHQPWGDAPLSAQLANLEGSAPASVHAYPAGDSAFGVRQMVGNVWEWTASVFLPYPGFHRDPYKEYSEPWFATHRVLRGGAFATSRRIASPMYRNFFTPERSDVFAGFRTCALDA